MAVVTQLLSYPVKGCAGISHPRAELTAAGLAHDRSFVVTDPDGVARTQRRDRRLAVITPRVTDGGRRLVLAADGAGELTVEVDTAAPRRPVDLLGRALRGIDQGEAAAGWLSEVLGAPSRLLRVPPEHDRVTDGRTAGTSGYADSAAVLVVSRASLDGLNARIARRGAEPVPPSRFRANVVVDGWEEPHTEDRALELAIGTARLSFAKLALRCAVVLVDQRTGAAAGPEPLRTLAGYRRADGGAPAFGSKYAVPAPGHLTVGDQVHVHQWAAPAP